MLRTYLTIFTCGITILAHIPYIKDTIIGKTKPHLFSWLIWLILTSINFFLQLQYGGGYSAWIIFVVMLVTLLIFILSLRQGEKSITRLDIIFLVLALVSLLFWLFDTNPLTAVILATLTSIFALLPTTFKSWRRPHEETLSMYAFNSSRHFLTILTITNYTLVTLINPVVWTVLNLLMALLIFYRRRFIVTVKDTQTASEDFIEI